MKKFISAVLALTFAFGTVTVHAQATRQIEVVVGNFRTFQAGQEFIARNAQGVLVEPFTFDGSVYIPLETLMQAMGNAVRLDLDAGILHFSDVASNAATNYTWLDQMGHTNYRSSGPDNSFTPWASGKLSTAGDAFDRGLIFSLGNWDGGLGAARDADTIGAISRAENAPWVSFIAMDYPLNGQYSTFAGSIVATEGSDRQTDNVNGAQIKIFGDGNLIWTSPPIAEGTREVNFSANVAGIQNLQIEVILLGFTPRTSSESYASGADASATHVGIVEARFER